VQEVPGAALEEFIIEDGGGSVRVAVRISETSIIPGFNIDGVGRHIAVALEPFG